MHRGIGQWQAYVVAGRTDQARRERLAQVPVGMRRQVKAHLRTYVALQKQAKPRSPS